MKYSKEVINSQGYPITFKCRECGEYYDLEDLKYYGTYRVCVHCLNKFQEKQKDEARNIPVHLSGELNFDEEEFEED